MESPGAHGRIKHPKGDELIGLEYRCCRGPLKAEAIRVVGPAAPGRYQLRAESGHQFTISRQKLERIFGDAGQRRCGCMPWVESSLITPQPESKGRAARGQEAPEPADAHAAAEPSEQQDAADPDGDAEAGTPVTQHDPEEPHAAAEEAPAATPVPAAAAVVFRDGEAQGALF